MKKMPAKFSRRWWKLWRSGAIDRQKVYLETLADELEKRYQESPWYYFNNVQDIRDGKRLYQWTVGFVDLMAVVRIMLHLPEKTYIEISYQLLGKAPYSFL